MMKFFSLLMLSLLSFAAVAQRENAAAAAVEQLRQAMLNSDQAALERLTAPQLSYAHSDGRVEDQKTFIQSFSAGKSPFQSLHQRDQTIDLIGKTAIVRHRFSAIIERDQQTVALELAVLQVWLKQGKKWKLLARHSTRLSG
jgi:hypothetical protein